MSDLVCPDCGAVPREQEPEAKFCPEDGAKLVTRAELPRDIWKDPAVRERLKEGWPANDICVIRCPECAQFGYYNEGSTFSCRFCDLTFIVLSDDDGDKHGYERHRTVSADEVVRLDDTLTETTDGYDNRTL